MIRAALVAIVVLLGFAATPAAEPADLRRLFPAEADVYAAQPGLNRLVLPPYVLASCRADLSDLRLFDRQGDEMAFLVDAGRATTVEVMRRFEPWVVDARRSEVRRRNGPPLRREAYELDVSRAEPSVTDWTLVVETSRNEFVARIEVEGQASSGTRFPIVADGSVFRIRGARSVEKLRLPLPPFDAPTLRVLIESEGSAWIEPAFRLESARALEAGGSIAVALDRVSLRHADGRTVLELDRPAGIVPDLLRLETDTGTFDRRVEVYDDGPTAGGRFLAVGNLFRVEGLVAIEQVDLALPAARGDRLRVVIEDGDSPPLVNAAFSAVIRQPSLIFSTSGVRADRPVATLRFGGGRSHRPRYDLSALLPPVGRTVQGTRAEIAASLYGETVVHPARIGDSRDNDEYDGTPALAFAMRPAAEIDRRVFNYSRVLHVPETPEGLSRITLAPDDLAILRDDLGDVRIVDDASRQWPYLVERDATEELVPVEIAGPEHLARKSRYLLRPNVSAVTIDRLLLDAEEPYLDRAFTLEGTTAAGERKTLASGRLVRPIGDPRPVGVELPRTRISSMELTVEDGDDAPLQLRAARGRVLLPRLYVTAPEGSYSMLLGATDVRVPRYELERVRGVVLAVVAAPIDAAGLEANPEYSLGARLKGSGVRQSVLIWGTLGLAVVVLTLLTLRLARREQAS